MTDSKPIVVAICGPTATGKTSVAVRLAQVLQGEIVSCDSMQIYHGMVIGTAAPTEAEQSGIAHHMIGFLPPTECYSAADYCVDASACITDIHKRGKLPIVVGGTGLYMDNLLGGSGFLQVAPSPSLRECLYQQAAQAGGEAMLKRLAQIDLKSAERIHPSDTKRIVRALEVYELTGHSISDLYEQQTGNTRYHAIRFGLDFSCRAKLYERINDRVDRMMALGLLDEVHTLSEIPNIHQGTAVQGIGYKELLDVLTKATPLDEAVEAIKRATRRYAKRQRTWFYRNPQIQWFYPDEQSEDDILSQMCAVVETEINRSDGMV